MNHLCEIDPVLLHRWHPVCYSKDLCGEAVKAIRVLSREIVLWRKGDKVMAWQDLCLHRGTKLSLGRVAEGSLVCAYHGWRYGEDGRCFFIPAQPQREPPAKACVRSYACREEHGLIWVSLGKPAGPPPYLPQWVDEEFRLIFCGPYDFAASAPRVVENFLDVAHFAFVHDGLLGDSAHPELPDYEVESTDNGLTARNIRVYQPDPDGTGQGADVSYTYRVMEPFCSSLEKEAAERQFVLFLGVCPLEENESRAFMLIGMNHGHEIPLEQLLSFQDQIVAQDKPIVESQRPEFLPLDLAEELHLRSDRTAIAYRKWLRELGLSFGTA